MRSNRGIQVGGVRGHSVGADEVDVATAAAALILLGDLYKRAAQKLDAKDLRGFLLHQGEWLIHLGRVDRAGLTQYVTQTQEYLTCLIRLEHPVRRRRSAVIHLVDKG